MFSCTFEPVTLSVGSTPAIAALRTATPSAPNTLGALRPKSIQ
jgi:hypothetical protein